MKTVEEMKAEVAKNIAKLEYAKEQHHKQQRQEEFSKLPMSEQAKQLAQEIQALQKSPAIIEALSEHKKQQQKQSEAEAFEAYYRAHVEQFGS
ncbi:hypothetical protein AB1K32_13315 [Metabacillus dongyingensis]|uniref:hypothetical protein n=1 Tax=Metabacillus dongyingensis TaxID=2874282 RepID=UPI003B8D2C7A